MTPSTTTPAPNARSLPPLWRALVVAACAVGLFLLTPAMGATATPDGDRPGPAGTLTTGGAPREAGTDRPVVMIGVAGLAWADITPQTPALWSLAQDSVGSLVVRSVHTSSCPADGWLAISSGTRAADSQDPCRDLLEVGQEGAVPGWLDYTTAAAEENFDARLGLLGDAVASTGTPATSIGPGAAIALADSTGHTQDHLRQPTDAEEWTTQTAIALERSRLVVIDAGDIQDAPGPVTTEQYHANQVQVADEHVAAIVQGILDSGTDPVIILSGISDSGGGPGLRVLAVSGPGQDQAVLTSSSTRQDGYVLATDQQPTLTGLLGITDAIPTGVTIGAPARALADPGAAVDRIDRLLDDELHAQAVRPLVPTYYSILVVLNLALFAAVALGLKRPAATRIRAFLARRFPRRRADENLVVARSGVLRLLRVVALSIGALPVSSFLANLLPWWRATPPALGLAVITLGWVALIVTIALIGPWRRRVLGPATWVAAVTAGVLTVDVITGATLQISAVMGVPTLVAGRFYGMNNTSFSLFTVSTLLVTVAIANPLVAAGRRKLAGVIVLIIGIVAAVIDGAPGIGADFGGPPALLPAYGLLALMAAGIGLTWRRVLVVLAAAAAATISLAFVDWLRPPDERTHLGRFFQTVLDGGLWPVIARKLDQNITILFGNRPLTILAICGVLTVVFVLSRPIRGAITSPGGGGYDWLSAGTPISRMGKDSPMLPPGIIAIGVALGLGLLVNDSGIAIPAIGVSVTVPLLLAACATWMLALEPADLIRANQEPLEPVSARGRRPARPHRKARLPRSDRG
ncbi:hypothetical protein EXU48_15300 [Occultella glacieicola]|uniref:Alkaline phosphatase family protein n=1 Tax=Occultella glacieicola TaxID=2518684 RepID=A0ABY2E2U2_9MICO|nr:hypothetical protein [Occultella glacieicola]TDE91519.1 hypothetical protein EXU48_15300 [Occultella glacieicola]